VTKHNKKCSAAMLYDTVLLYKCKYCRCIVETLDRFSVNVFRKI